MLDHVSIQCADVATSGTFYDAVLATIGGERIMEFGEVIGYGVPPMPDFWLGPRNSGEGFRETHLAFSAPDRAAVAEGGDQLVPQLLFAELDRAKQPRDVIGGAVGVIELAPSGIVELQHGESSFSRRRRARGAAGRQSMGAN